MDTNRIQKHNTNYDAVIVSNLNKGLTVGLGVPYKPTFRSFVDRILDSNLAEPTSSTSAFKIFPESVAKGFSKGMCS